MARSAKTRTDKAEPSEEAIVDKPNDEIGESVDPVQDTEVTDQVAVEAVADFKEDVRRDELPEPVAPAVVVDEPLDVSAAREPAPEPRVTPAPVVVKRTGFVPVVLGGVVAAAIGFAAGWQDWLPVAANDPNAALIAEQADRLSVLEANLAAVPTEMPDLAPLALDIAALRAELAPVAERLAALEERLNAIERAPAADGTLSATAIASWETELATLREAVTAQSAQSQAIADAAATSEAEIAALRDELAGQQEQVRAMIDEATERLNVAQTTVAEIEQSATASAVATLQRAALTRIQAAMDAGTPFDDAVAELSATGLALPETLTSVAVDGVPSVASLSALFPEAARSAMATARAEGLADDGTNGFVSFLRSQLDVRSVAPREGDDPDAILSRAEAAVGEGQLTDALAEIAALPEVVRASMSDWTGAAEMRVNALAALQSISEALPAPETSN